MPRPPALTVGGVSGTGTGPSRQPLPEPPGPAGTEPDWVHGPPHRVWGTGWDPRVDRWSELRCVCGALLGRDVDGPTAGVVADAHVTSHIDQEAARLRGRWSKVGTLVLRLPAPMVEVVGTVLAGTTGDGADGDIGLCGAAWEMVQETRTLLHRILHREIERHLATTPPAPGFPAGPGARYEVLVEEFPAATDPWMVSVWCDDPAVMVAARVAADTLDSLGVDVSGPVWEPAGTRAGPPPGFL